MSKNPIVFWFISVPKAIFIITLSEIGRLYHVFSIPELLRTLFDPWKRDEVSMANLSLSDRFHVWAGNMATRFVAMLIRLITIFTGLLTMAICFLIGLGLVALVIFMPLAVIFLFSLSIKS